MDNYEVTFTVTYTVKANSVQEAVAKAEELQHSNHYPDDDCFSCYVDGELYS